MLHYVHQLENGRLEKIVGLFVIYALGLLIVVLLVIGGYKKFFGHYQLKTVLESGYGLRPGIPVNVIGIKAGEVDTVHINENSGVDVVISLNNKYKEMIRKDSLARVVSLDLMGNTALEISVGSPTESFLTDGESLKGMSRSYAESLSGDGLPVFAKADKIMDNVLQVTKGLTGPIKRMDNILKKFDEISEKENLYLKLSNLAGDLRRLVARLDNTAVNVQAASKNFSKITENGGASMVEIRKGAEMLPEMMSDWKGLMGSIKMSAGEMHSVILESGDQITSVRDILGDFKRASKDLPNMVVSTQENIDEITRVIEGAEKNWIVRGFIERKNTNGAITIDARDHHYE